VAQHDLARRQATPPQRRPPVTRSGAVERLGPADRDTDPTHARVAVGRVVDRLGPGDRDADLAHARVAVGRVVDRLEPGDRDADLADDRVDQAVEQGLLAGQVVVERHRLDAEVAGEAAHRHRLDPVGVGDRDGGREQAVPAQRRPRFPRRPPSPRGGRRLRSGRPLRGRRPLRRRRPL
jgi:hypothetical protein